MEQAWHAEFVASARPLRRHEWWRQRYRGDRYARHLAQRELNQRFRDLVLNFLVLTPEAKVGLVPMSEAGIRWIELITDTLEEFSLRYGPYPAGFIAEVHREQPAPDFAGELAQKAASALSSRGLVSQQVFIKYGNPEHMRALHEEGRLRLQPASYYRQATHNGAIRDDERSLEVSLALSRQTILNVVQNPQDVPTGLESQRFDLRFQYVNDFWLYCVSSSTEARLFVDFEATACIIIKDRAEFGRRLRAATAKALEGAHFRAGPAMYIDPLRPRSARIDVPMSKHFRYTYQEECRFVWESPGPHPLKYADLELGSLADISDLVLL
jgi:hypothetical protein